MVLEALVIFRFFKQPLKETLVERAAWRTPSKREVKQWQLITQCGNIQHVHLKLATPLHSNVWFVFATAAVPQQLYIYWHVSVILRACVRRQSYQDILRHRWGRWCRTCWSAHWDSLLGSASRRPPAPPCGEACWQWLSATGRHRSPPPQACALLWFAQLRCQRGRAARGRGTEYRNRMKCM